MEATAEVSRTFNEKIRKYCDMTLLSCAYARTGNVLKVRSYDEIFIKFFKEKISSAAFYVNNC